MLPLSATFDVAVIGAGPVGCVTALAFAGNGARVLLLEARRQVTQRLAGEWLHPAGVAVLQGLGLGPLLATTAFYTGQGFVVLPADGSAPIVLQYPGDMYGLSCEHGTFVRILRAAVTSDPGIQFIPGAKVSGVEAQRLSFQRRECSGTSTVLAAQIVGASGRSWRARQWLGLPHDRCVVSYMAGIRLEAVTLPFESFGHLILGGPGPAFLYRIGPSQLRLCLDVPAHRATLQEGPAFLWDAYSPVLPAPLRPALRHALQARPIAWAANSIRLRRHYGRDGFALVGDAVGSCHPVTAAGMTLGFLDAVCLARSRSFQRYRRERVARTRVPELLAMLLYEVFTGEHDGAVVLQHALYRMWRQRPEVGYHTMRLLSGVATAVADFVRPVCTAMTMAMVDVLKASTHRRQWRRAARVMCYDGARLQWLVTSVLGAPKQLISPPMRTVSHSSLPPTVTLSSPRRVFPGPRASVADNSAVLRRSRPVGSRLPSLRSSVADGSEALRRAVGALVSLQRVDGSWEGEVVWCPLLAAQYVLMCHITATVLPLQRQVALARHFTTTCLPDGGWGLGRQTGPSLFVTTLVYVAARLLGGSQEDPLLSAARSFILRQGGAMRLPAWGKFWLALLHLSDWHDVPPILPEVWRLPRWIPLHPSHFYCHTRLIYTAMAYLYGCKLQAALTPLTRQIRTELYATAPQGLKADIYTRPSLVLRLGYGLCAIYDRWHTVGLRERVLAELIEHMRGDLRTTDYAALSPVNGLLGIISLWLHDPTDPDMRQALGRLDAWFWQDEQRGLRVAGALSSTWDTAFALQALAAASPAVEVSNSLRRGRTFLVSQQMRITLDDTQLLHRLDPTGGFCFGRVWHGWPISDCTAEALLALLDTASDHASQDALTEAVRFICRCQNADGGFGSYEPRRSIMPLEWLNPTEMFGNCMTEHSYVECTASCLAALSAVHKRHPALLAQEISTAMARAMAWLQRQQREDGSWPGSWGIHFIYGTLFGIRGLLAAGASCHDGAIRRACRWLVQRQRPDGGWGEHFRGCQVGYYVEHDESQVIQTAWAMLALLEARAPAWDTLARGASFLITMQQADGGWPQQDPAGVFFHTAPLDYTLYRSYFPVWALGLYESYRREWLNALREYPV